jgi:hypothetical protein
VATGKLIDALAADGFVVLDRFFDPAPLSVEVDRALADGCRQETAAHVAVGNSFRYVPMMCETTPVSLSLLDALVGRAAELLGRRALPTRAKATRYAGSTAWHRDSDLPIASIGVLAYLEPLTGATGALRVVAGSHATAAGDPPAETATGPGRATALETRPGDVIVLDEHLWHSSAGGQGRRQWRVDFVVDPVSPEEAEIVRTYFARIYEPSWDGGYDHEKYPSYGAPLHTPGLPWMARLEELGACRLAQEQQGALDRSRDRGPTSAW